MIDALGNKIREGDLLTISADLLKDLVFQAIKVQEGGITTPQGGETPGVLIVALTFPVPKPSENLMQFKCLRNPESEKLLDQLAGGRKPS